MANHLEFFQSKIEESLTDYGVTVLEYYDVAEWETYKFPHAHVVFGEDTNEVATDAGQSESFVTLTQDVLVFVGYSVTNDTQKVGLLNKEWKRIKTELQRHLSELTIENFETPDELSQVIGFFYKGSQPLTETDEQTKGTLLMRYELKYTTIYL